MPTDEWFEKIKAHVDFKDKFVIDYGCAEGIMCYLAREDGANHVIGVDNQGNYDASLSGIQFIHDYIEEYGTEINDIGIFSMIIHWVGDKEFRRLAVHSNEVVVVFREPNEGYQVPINGKWFPTEEELDQTMSGFTKIHSEELMEQDNGKKIRLCIYDRKKG